MATTDSEDDFTTPLPDEERTPPEGLQLSETATVEFCPPTPPPVTGRPMTFDPKWRTETVVALARGIDADAAFDRLPILADALEEAGCDHTTLLHHCRTCPHPFASCWVVNVVLDRVPGELPPPLVEFDRLHSSPVPLGPSQGVSSPSRPQMLGGRPANPFRGIIVAFVFLVVCKLFFSLLLGTPSPPTTPAVATTSIESVQTDTP